MVLGKVGDRIQKVEVWYLIKMIQKILRMDRYSNGIAIPIKSLGKTGVKFWNLRLNNDFLQSRKIFWWIALFQIKKKKKAFSFSQHRKESEKRSKWMGQSISSYIT